MLNPVQIEAAKAKGILFICAMCQNWHEGQDHGLRNRHKEPVCSSTFCKSLLNGGSFEDYKGPLTGHLSKYCHVCGNARPEYILEPQLPHANRLGCCKECLERLKGLAVEPDRGGNWRIKWTTEARVGPNKYDEVVL